MTRMTIGSFCLMASATLLVAGCGQQSDTEHAVPAAETTPAPAQASAAGHDGLHGKIIETMDAGGYTYVQLDTGREKIWAAGPLTEGLSVGQELAVASGMLMTDFQSKALDRTFAEIYFLTSFDAPAAAPAGHGAMGGHGAPAAGGDASPISGTKTVLDDAHVEGVAKATGGYTVAEIYARRDKLADEAVLVRGRVVKFTPNIMGINWVHIQDGTGDETSHDLTVTTEAEVAVGDLILVDGPLSVDRDFGAGYRYAVIIEGAHITVE